MAPCRALDKGELERIKHRLQLFELLRSACTLPHQLLALLLRCIVTRVKQAYFIVNSV